MSRFFKTERLTLAKQLYSMKEKYPQFAPSRKRAQVCWVGPLRPSALSRDYTVEIVLKEGISPRVRVLEPLLKQRSDGEPIPHVYPGNHLCLHLPGEWQPRMFISDSIVPWTLLWLLFYEYWRATGEWIGGGVHPPRAKSHGRRAA